MEKFNNHGLDVINSRVCMALALDDFDDEEQIKHIKSKQVQNRDYTQEVLDLKQLLEKLCRREELTEDEEKNAILLLNVCSYSAVLMPTESIPAKVIKDFCKAVDNNKKLPELYREDKLETIKKLSIRFEKETKMPQNSNAENISMEYLGYYNSEACQIILCPDRIRKTSELLKEKKVNTTSHALYGMVFIHALSHALLDRTNKIDKEGNLVRYDDKYQKIDPNFVSNEEEKQHVIFAQFMEESVATIMTLYYFLKVNTQQYKVLREWLLYQPQEYEFGLELFDMLENGSDLIENYCEAWRGRKKALKIYCSGKKNELSDLKF